MSGRILAHVTEDEIEFINQLNKELLQNYLEAIKLRKVWKGSGLYLDREEIIEAAKARLDSLSNEKI